MNVLCTVLAIAATGQLWGETKMPAEWVDSYFPAGQVYWVSADSVVVSSEGFAWLKVKDGVIKKGEKSVKVVAHKDGVFTGYELFASRDKNGKWRKYKQVKWNNQWLHDNSYMPILKVTKSDWMPGSGVKPIIRPPPRRRGSDAY